MLLIFWGAGGSRVEYIFNWEGWEVGEHRFSVQIGQFVNKH